MKTLKEFLETKLTEVGFFNIKWERKDETAYVSYTDPSNYGTRVTMSLVELADELLWQESGV